MTSRSFRTLLLPAAALVLWAGLALAASAPLKDADPKLGKAIDAWAKPLVANGHLSGQLLVTRYGKVIVERSYGFANRELRVPITPETRLCVASVTKPMTVLIAYRLMESKAIAYRDSIARWIPDFPRADSITIGLLLQHRSGVRHEILPDSESVRPRTAAEMVEIAKHLPLDFPPGSQSSYSTGGFTVLARVLELASGKSYTELLQQEIFRPLGMTHSSHPNSIELLPGRAACYVPSPSGIENAAFQDFSGLVGGGSVWSTARDIHRFVDAIVTGRIGETARQSWVRKGRLSFNGQTSGFRAYADWDSATGLGVVFAGNVATGAPALLRDAVRKLAAGDAPPGIGLPAIATGPPPPERLRTMEGTYQLGNGTRLRLWSRGTDVYCNDWPLVPTADGAWFSPRDYGLVRPVAGPDGRITRLDWTQSGTVYPAPRAVESGSAR
jgi:CubicO group peptidase (beta-lactamase class C family)